MADEPTISGTIGGTTITTSGALAGEILTSLIAQINSEGYNFVNNYLKGDTVPAHSFLTLQNDPSVTLGDTDGINTNGNAATIFGGGATSQVIATGAILNYTGAAGNILAGGFSGSIVDTATAATIAATGGAYSVLTTGADTLILGGGTSAIIARSVGNASHVTVQGGAYYAAGSADTISASAGSNTISAGSSDVLFATGNTLFYTGAGAATFIGATGSDTINTGGANDLIFVGTSSDLIVSYNGVDTVAGGTVAPTVFAGQNEKMTLVSTAGGGVLVQNGPSATIDGSQTAGGNHFFSSASFGNATLIGSTAGSDTFSFNRSVSATAASFTIQNFSTGDQVYLDGYSAGDIATANASLGSGSSTFTLSDGTTVSFIGSHPTNVAGTPSA